MPKHLTNLPTTHPLTYSPLTCDWKVINDKGQVTMTKRILLCDDELHILRAAEFKFKRAGYEVVCASDGQEGWERIQEQRPDIVVTDWQMPRVSRLGLGERIRQTPATA